MAHSDELVAPWVWQVPVRFVEFFESQFLYGPSYDVLDSSWAWKSSAPKPWSLAFYATTSEPSLHHLYDLMMVVSIASSVFALLLGRFAFSTCCRSVRVQNIHVALTMANVVVLAWCTVAQCESFFCQQRGVSGVPCGAV
jgi:hypothetical protein